MANTHAHVVAAAREVFRRQDQDRSGNLDAKVRSHRKFLVSFSCELTRQELTEVLRELYKKEGVSRGQDVVCQEVAQTVSVFRFTIPPRSG